MSLPAVFLHNVKYSASSLKKKLLTSCEGMTWLYSAEETTADKEHTRIFALITRECCLRTPTNILSLSAESAPREFVQCRWLMGNVLCMTCRGSLFLRLLLPRNFRERCSPSKSFFYAAALGAARKEHAEQKGDGAIKKMLTCSRRVYMRRRI